MTAADRPTRRLKLIVSYDGSSYHGFQRQARGLITVQDVLCSAIEAVTGAAPVRFAAAGRTDAGVHARGQVVAFDTAGTVPVDRVARALNAHLPPEVAVVSATEADAEFQPRFAAAGKSYAYTFYGWGGRARQPLLDRYALYRPGALDIGRMDEGARLLVGRHDFSAFQDTGRPVSQAVRTVETARVTARRYGAAPWEGLEVGTIEVKADGFLYHMVRVIAGTLLEIGRGRLEPADVTRALAERRRVLAGPTVPPQGLCLMEVHYRPES